MNQRKAMREGDLSVLCYTDQLDEMNSFSCTTLRNLESSIEHFNEEKSVMIELQEQQDFDQSIEFLRQCVIRFREGASSSLFGDKNLTEQVETANNSFRLLLENIRSLGMELGISNAS